MRPIVNGFRDPKINTTSAMTSSIRNLGKFGYAFKFAYVSGGINEIIIFCLILMKNIPEIPKKSLWILGNEYRWLSRLIFGHIFREIFSLLDPFPVLLTEDRTSQPAPALTQEILIPRAGSAPPLQ